MSRAADATRHYERARPIARATVLFLVGLLLSLSAQAACKGTVYLTIDTGHMGPAEKIVDVLARHEVKATFFLANERAQRGGSSLDPSWAPFWKRLAAEGHAFGNHTWRHWYFRRDVGADKVAYVSRNGETEHLDRAAMCAELQRVDDAFHAMTGRRLDPIWRAPGGRTTPRALEFAAQCGYPRHVHWADAGFLGDELPSGRYPNDALLKKALRDIKSGDILVMHLGIWSRKDPWWPVLEPLIVGLKARGLCFATLRQAA